MTPASRSRTCLLYTSGRAGDRPADGREVLTAVAQVVFRQQRRDGAAHFRHAVGLIEAAVQLLDRALQQRLRDRAGGIVDGLEAVSYTHLDVYKRQDERCRVDLRGFPAKGLEHNGLSIQIKDV